MEGMSGCYIPNSATLDNWQAPLLSPISHSFFDNSSQESKLLNGCVPLGVSDLLISESTTPVDLNMNSFSFSPLDIDPMPSFFPFNSCSSPYKEYTPFKDAKNPDSGDVFLSLKHTIVHPSSQVRTATPIGSNTPQFGGQLSPLSTHAHYNQSFAFGSNLCPSQTSSNIISPNMTYNAYPQIQVSTTSNSGPSGIFYTSDIGNAHHTPAPQPHTIQPVFPAAMSVNLSMNMTMGVSNFGEQFAATTPQHQVQWTAATPQYTSNPTAPVQGYSQPVQVSYNSPSPTYAAGNAPGTYTFTAEFRPVENISLSPIEREFSACGTTLKPIASTFYPCKQSSTTPTSVSMENHHNNQSTTMLKPRSRTIPTGKAACFPANVAPESPSVQALVAGDSPSAILMESCDSTNGKSNLCRICGKTYARPSTLKTHMRTHSGERPYRCSTCDKSFSQAANLTAHIRTHSGEKPFRCPVCDRRFSQSSSVTTHMRTHSGERPYRCYMCKKAFSDSSTLTKHLRIHSGEKPYQCKLCLLRFSQSGNLNRHMRVHAIAA